MDKSTEQTKTTSRKHRRHTKNLQRKPNALLYWGAREYINVVNRLKFNLTATGERVHGPALLLSNHTSNEDYKYIAGSVRPARISFLATYHWFTFKKLAFWLKAIGAIPKYQFATDLESMKKIKYIVQDRKGVVYIAPEGTVYSSGHLGYISPAIAKMIRFLKVPVYTSKIQGAGLGNAKWSRHLHKGMVNVDTHLLLTADEAKTLPADEIMKRLTTALAYNEFDFQKQHNVLVKGSDKADGFETMFYKCPLCGSEFHIEAHGNDVQIKRWLLHSRAGFKAARTGGLFRYKAARAAGAENREPFRGQRHTCTGAEGGGRNCRSRPGAGERGKCAA